MELSDVVKEARDDFLDTYSDDVAEYGYRLGGGSIRLKHGGYMLFGRVQCERMPPAPVEKAIRDLFPKSHTYKGVDSRLPLY